jgi:hypothetical protein
MHYRFFLLAGLYKNYRALTELIVISGLKQITLSTVLNMETPIICSSLWVVEQIPRSALLMVRQNTSPSFKVQQDSCLKFHGIYELSEDPYFTRQIMFCS